MDILSLDQEVDSPESVVVAARIQVPFPAASLLGVLLDVYTHATWPIERPPRDFLKLSARLN